MIGLFLLGLAFVGWMLCVVIKYFGSSRCQRLPVLAVLLQNQGDTVEGFVRRAAAKNPGFRLVLVDMGSSDDTPEILNRMKKPFGFNYQTGNTLGDFIYDARGLHGKKLINAPIFSEIKREGAGFVE